jgi:hypothetical protein
MDDRFRARSRRRKNSAAQTSSAPKDGRRAVHCHNDDNNILRSSHEDNHDSPVYKYNDRNNSACDYEACFSCSRKRGTCQHQQARGGPGNHSCTNSRWRGWNCWKSGSIHQSCDLTTVDNHEDGSNCQWRDGNHHNDNDASGDARARESRQRWEYAIHALDCRGHRCRGEWRTTNGEVLC